MLLETGRFRRITLFILFILFIFIILAMPYEAEGSPHKKPKAVILILDQVGVEDLVKARTPNMDTLITNGGFGIMNARPEAILNQNRASSYLTLGMGVRITAPDWKDWDLVKTSKGQWSLQNFSVLKNNIEDGKLERLGFIGRTAKEKGLVVGLIGNSDYKSELHKEGALLAIDEQGNIPVFESEISKLSGSQLNRLMESVDILFIDYGKTVIANRNTKEHLIKAIEEADSFLGKVVEQIGVEQNLFMVLTPNPSKAGFKNLNLALTPIIYSSWGTETSNGLLTSSSTKRPGLVTNLNFIPTVFSFFEIPTTGESITIAKTNKVLKEEVLRNEKLYLNLNKTRYLLHGTYIFLILLILVILYTNRLQNWKREGLIHFLSLVIISIPLSSMLAPLFMDYSKIFLGHLLILLVAALMVRITYLLKLSYLQKVAWICISTAALILFDTLSKTNFLLNTPFGFNDVIIGGRFYGMNNDLMGILIGASMMGVFCLGESYKLKSRTFFILTTTLAGMSVLALSPQYGANVGGTIGAAVVLIITVLLILNKKLSYKRLLVIVTFVFIVEIAIAALDANSGETTHAGRLFESVLSNGIEVFYDMIIVKIKQVILMLILPPWNIVLFFQAFILWKLLKEKSQIVYFKNSNPTVYKGFLTIVIGSIVIFSFNDTGVISSAIMLTYLLVPLGYCFNFCDKEG